jgi:lysophospholipase L1-like esterase
MRRIFSGLVILSFALGAQSEIARVEPRAQVGAVETAPGAFSCDLTFDLSACKEAGSAYAQLIVPMQIEGAGYTMLRLFATNDAGAERLVAATCPNAGHKAAFFDVTDLISTQLPARHLDLRIKQAAGSEIELSLIENRPVSLRISAEAQPRCGLSDSLSPVWASARMVNETILPVSTNGAPAEGQLLFAPKGSVTVRNYALDKTYQEGADYVVDGRTIRLLPGSSIPFATRDQLYPDSADAAPGTMESCKGGYVAYTEGSYWNDHQIAVSYDHRDSWGGPVPFDGTGTLAATNTKLKNGKPIKIALLGDSISAGASASKSHPPYIPGWGELLIRGLGNRFQSEITFVNPSRGGATAGWGKKVTPDFIVPEKPDLFIIAFGMNDANGTPVKSYVASIKTIMGMVSAENPDTEFILVASMPRNEDWRSLTPMNGYLAALKELESEQVAVADVWSIGEYILKAKRYCDVSGNHVNHPNDFMVRVYAQVTGALLGL